MIYSDPISNYDKVNDKKCISDIYCNNKGNYENSLSSVLLAFKCMRVV